MTTRPSLSTSYKKENGDGKSPVLPRQVLPQSRELHVRQGRRTDVPRVDMRKGERASQARNLRPLTRHRRRRIMLVPVTVHPRVCSFFEPDRVCKCLCGKEAPMKKMLLVWTHPIGSNEYAYYAVHSESDCFTRYVSQGSC